ncbi:EAL domain-containing protein [Marinicella rhabdoformis]|uniref:EAL domain-containing protein n=1 Tax=Marinicella rhabdoformis TaxID=2580566 RepID=UPI0012AEC690
MNQTVRLILLNLLFAVVYTAVTYLAYKMMVRPSLAVTLWPATGLGVAFIVIWGRKFILGIVLGELISSILLYRFLDAMGFNQAFMFDLLLLATSIFRPCFAGFMARKLMGMDLSLMKIRDIIRFFLFAAVIPCFITTLIFSGLLMADGHYTADNVVTKFVAWYVGDLLSIMIVCPMVFSLFAKPRSIWKPRIWQAAVPTLAGFCLVFFLFDSLRANDEVQIKNTMALKSRYIEKVGTSQQLSQPELIDFLESNHQALVMDDYCIELNDETNGQLLYGFNTGQSIRFPNINNTLKFRIKDDHYSLKLTPINRFYDGQYSWSLWSIVFVSMLYTGLVGAGLLAMTGRNALTDLEIKRRTKLLNEANKDLAVSNENYRHIVDRQPVVFWKINMLEDRIVYVNQEAESILGYPIMQWHEEPHFLSKKIHPDDLSKVKWNIQESFATGERMELEYRVKHASGEYRWFRDVLNIPSEFQDSVECMGMMIDITDKKNAENKIKHLAFYDYLTNLPNRQNFQSKLSRLMKQGQEEGHYGAVMFLDMDRFKILNDALGHHFGDQLLVNIAERLNEFTDEVAVVARFGGDEFVIATQVEYETPNDTAVNVIMLAEDIIKKLAEPYQIGEHKHTCTVSMGLAVYPSPGSNVNDIIKHADAAMYRSKEQGRNQLTIYHDSMKAHNDQVLFIEQILREAVANNNFILKYQPITNRNREIISYESLIRIFHNGEVIFPDQFIPVAEETGMIQEMGRWVIEEACRAVNTLNKPVTINVSSHQFHQQGFIKHIEQCMATNNISKDMLTVELTEGVVVGNLHEIIYKFNRLKEIGVQIAIDDFGTGYSSLEYLRKIPINYLKIDKSFVRDLHADKSAQVIIETIIAMAKHLNLEVVAEGVESDFQHKMLLDLGCDYFQGYLFGKPAGIKLSA